MKCREKGDATWTGTNTLTLLLRSVRLVTRVCIHSSHLISSDSSQSISIFVHIGACVGSFANAYREPPVPPTTESARDATATASATTIRVSANRAYSNVVWQLSPPLPAEDGWPRPTRFDHSVSVSSIYSLFPLPKSMISAWPTASSDLQAVSFSSTMALCFTSSWVSLLVVVAMNLVSISWHPISPPSIMNRQSSASSFQAYITTIVSRLTTFFIYSSIEQTNLWRYRNSYRCHDDYRHSWLLKSELLHTIHFAVTNSMIDIFHPSSS